MPESNNDPQPRTQQVIDVLQPIIRNVQAIIGKVRVMAWFYLVGAVVLWLVLIVPGGVEADWLFGLSVFGLVVFAVPAGVIFLFYMALSSVVQLPARLLEKAGVGETHARSMLEAASLSAKSSSSERAGKLMRTLVDIRGLVMDSKGMLVEYAALLRLANPFVLAVVGLAAVAGFFVVVAAVIGLLIVVF